MNVRKIQSSKVKLMLSGAVFGVLLAIVLFARSQWHKSSNETASTSETDGAQAEPPNRTILLTDQAIDNLGLKAKPNKPQTYWKTIQIPGMVVDQPGRSDRGIVSPITGVVASVNHFVGDTVQQGDVLFTVRLLSESIHTAQSELFKATQDIGLMQSQRERLKGAGAAIPQARLIEVENQITRLQTAVKAYGQELLNRGLQPQQIQEIAKGNYVNEISIIVPSITPQNQANPLRVENPQLTDASATYEVQEVRVELGQQVEAGQTLCLLSNHQLLAIEGRAFRDETALLEQSVKEGWPVEVDFLEVAGTDWPPFTQKLKIRHLANTIDPVSRSFAFLLPLENQSRVVEVEGRKQMLWRFRPGQKVRLLVKTTKLDDVFVVPAQALARDDAEAFVFTQNVNTFERHSVRVLYQDRQHAVLAKDGSLLPGIFVVQNGAAQLNRMTKSQSSDSPKGFHVHADGSLHKNEDEGK